MFGYLDPLGKVGQHKKSGSCSLCSSGFEAVGWLAAGRRGVEGWLWPAPPCVLWQVSVP